jgi:probable HAF family extracellular repeat protein
MERHRVRHLFNATLAVSALFAAAAAQAQLSLFTLTDLGRVASSSQVAINDAGQAAGTFTLSDGSQRAFLYSGGTRMNLGTLPGHNSSAGFGINSHGHVTGSSGDSAFVFTSQTGMQPVSGLFPGAIGFGINDAGQVVGKHEVFGEVTAAFLHTPGIGQQGLGFTAAGSFAYAINNAGQVTGTAFRDLDFEVFVAKANTPAVFIGLLGAGRAINDAGQVAGAGAVAFSGQPLSAFLHTPGVGTLQLGALSGDERSDAFGINDAGHVVGASFSDSSSPDAFLYTSQAGMVGLQSLLDPVTGQGWSLGTAWDINNKGQIVGVGRFEGEEHAYLLTPSQCPAPRGLLAKLGLRGS